MYYVYIMSNWNDKVIYIGVTGNLEKRVYQHKNKTMEGFTKKYNVNKLVYFEDTTDVKAALEREKQLKKWSRQKKNDLINSMNPTWADLSNEWYR
ncbi:MAG: GIY-YIG nuclease family protein [Oscillospiraceae bacterium]|nr:GIY-YIG nuclease family protein [Oscillospiraceae bacterium]